MRVSDVDCKRALGPSKLPGLDYALNPYRGCAFGCVYCYSPAVLREARPLGSFVEARRNIPNALARELKSSRRGLVGIGTVTDPYQPLEGRYRLARLCLEQLLRYDFPISIQTKSPIVIRDLDGHDVSAILDLPVYSSASCRSRHQHINRSPARVNLSVDCVQLGV